MCDSSPNLSSQLPSSPFRARQISTTQQIGLMEAGALAKRDRLVVEVVDVVEVGVAGENVLLLVHGASVERILEQGIVDSAADNLVQGAPLGLETAGLLVATSVLVLFLLVHLLLVCHLAALIGNGVTHWLALGSGVLGGRIGRQDAEDHDGGKDEVLGKHFDGFVKWFLGVVKW